MTSLFFHLRYRLVPGRFGFSKKILWCGPQGYPWETKLVDEMGIQPKEEIRMIKKHSPNDMLKSPYSVKIVVALSTPFVSSLRFMLGNTNCVPLESVSSNHNKGGIGIN